MSVQVKRRRDNAANVAAYAGAQGELIIDTTNNRLTVHDGVTPGGWVAAKLTETLTNTRAAVADASYNVLASDRSIAFTALFASRNVVLPPASAFPVGTPLTIFDECGSCSATNAIVAVAAGSDKIDGASSANIATPYGYLVLQSDGAARWTVIDQALGSNASQQLVQGPNGAAIQFQVIEQTVTLQGVTTIAGVQIPANCIVLGCGTRVLSAVSGAASFSVGTAGNLTQFGGALSIASGATNFGIVGPYGSYSATNLIVSATGGSFTGGSLRLSLKLMLLPVSSS